MRRRVMAILAGLTLIGSGVCAGAGPAYAVTEAAPGAPCDSSDLGRRQGWVDTTTVTPTITHFKGFFVTAGSTGTQVVQLTSQQQLTVTVLGETTISTGFSVPLLTKLDVTAHFAVTKVTQSTTTEVRTLTWNFTQPGYYGVYSGVHKVSGQMTALQCNRVQKPGGTWATEWIRRAGGTYTTWGRDQEGVIRCEDVVPANTIMRDAQIELGCDGLAAQRAARAAWETDDVKPAKPAVGGPTTQAAPTGYTCEPGIYHIVSANGMFVTAGGKVPGIFYFPSAASTTQWTLCNGPTDATGFQPSVLVSRPLGLCVGARPGATAIEGAGIDISACETVPVRQKLYIYRDVPGSDLVGIQLAYRGGMVGQDEMVTGTVLHQSEGGMSDGTGTFHLTLS